MVFNHQNPNKVARALTLTGGGVRGLFTATVLSELEAKSGRDLSKQFDVLVGTSIGGIICIGLACGISATHIAKAIHDQANLIFGKPASCNPLGLFTTRHRPNQLRRCIGEILGSAAQMSIRDVPRNIVVPSVDAAENKIVYFSNMARIGAVDTLDASLLDVALATSAAPTYLPPHPIGEKIYLDGGLASNNPDIEAIYFCANVLSRPLDSIRLLSIGTGGAQFPLKSYDKMDTGGLGWMVKHKIVDRIMSLQESKASNIVSDLLRDRYMRIDTFFDKPHALDDVRAVVIDMLRQRAVSVFNERWMSDGQRMADFVR